MFPIIKTPELDIVPGTKSNPLGSKSSKSTPVASPGPLFSTRTVKVTVSPTEPVAGDADLVISKSATSNVTSALSSSSSLWSPSSLFESLSGSP